MEDRRSDLTLGFTQDDLIEFANAMASDYTGFAEYFTPSRFSENEPCLEFDILDYFWQGSSEILNYPVPDDAIGIPIKLLPNHKLRDLHGDEIKSLGTIRKQFPAGLPIASATNQYEYHHDIITALRTAILIIAVFITTPMFTQQRSN